MIFSANIMLVDKSTRIEQETARNLEYYIRKCYFLNQ